MAQIGFILNAKELNEFINTTHFKLENFKTATNLIFPNEFTVTLDLQGVYFLVSVAENHRIFLRFQFKDEICQFKILSFGLCTCPYVLQRFLSW